jgi:hypothetical protein
MDALTSWDPRAEYSRELQRLSRTRRRGRRRPGSGPAEALIVKTRRIETPCRTVIILLISGGNRHYPRGHDRRRSWSLTRLICPCLPRSTSPNSAQKPSRLSTKLKFCTESDRCGFLALLKRAAHLVGAPVGSGLDPNGVREPPERRGATPLPPASARLPARAAEGTRPDTASDQVSQPFDPGFVVVTRIAAYAAFRIPPIWRKDRGHEAVHHHQVL